MGSFFLPLSRILGRLAAPGAARTGRGKPRHDRRIHVLTPRIEPLEDRRMLSIVYVDDSASGLNDGTSWVNAYTSLQSALSAAVSGTEIRVAQGVYKPTTGSSRTVSFTLKNNISIYGGYAGYGAADPNARDVALYTSILSGNIGTVGSTLDNSYHVVVGEGTNSSAVLDGFTITAGSADGTDSYSYGGGMCIDSSSPTVRGCTFIANSAISGGGVYNVSSSPTFTNCTFTANSVWHYGGGMYNDSSSLRLTNCTFTENSAPKDGGGMYASATSLTLVNCTFNANSGYDGGGVYNYYSPSTTFTDCTFNANSAKNGGGGVYNYYSPPTTVRQLQIYRQLSLKQRRRHIQRIFLSHDIH